MYKMNKKLSVLLLCCIAFSSIFILNFTFGQAIAVANGYKISGYIDLDFNYPDSDLKSGFLIELVGYPFSSQSNSSGYFEINNIPSNLSGYAIKISKTNYLYRQITDVKVTSDLQIGSQSEPIKMWAGDIQINGVQDNAINMMDIIEIARHFNSTSGDGKYIIDSDINRDTAINMSDIMIVARHFNHIQSNYPIVTISNTPSNTPSSIPLPTPLPSECAQAGFIQFEGGANHTVALKRNGTVWVWGGDNRSCQLGNWRTYSINPIQIMCLSGIKSVAAGSNHSLALKDDGTVWSWGDNMCSQLGNGIFPVENYNVKKVSDLTGIKAISAGGSQSVALKEDGTVWIWGDIYYTKTVDALNVNGLDKVKAISAGFSHTLALKEDGTVWAWGANRFGQLGDGTCYGSSAPHKVKGLNSIKAISAGENYSLALKEDGTVWAWGFNGDGRLGDGTETDRLIPVQIKELSAISNITAGNCDSLAVKQDGTLWTWGIITYSTMSNPDYIPVQSKGISGANEVFAGENHFFIKLKDNKVLGWGHNELGQFGNGSAGFETSPIQVTSLKGVETVSASFYHTLVLKQDGTVYAMGDNQYGQLGDSSYENRAIPVQVKGLSGVKTLAAGGNHSVALKEDGTVWVWGDNSGGQVGDGTFVNRNIPVMVEGLNNVKAIAAGTKCSVALKEDNTVWAWGTSPFDSYWGTNSRPILLMTMKGADSISVRDNNAGQNDVLTFIMNNGTVIEGPIRIIAQSYETVSITGVEKLSAGCRFMIALKSDGIVWGWGYNNYRQLGEQPDLTNSETRAPLQIKGLTGVSDIAAGCLHTLALKDDGTVWGVGSNYWGELGNENLSTYQNMVQVKGISGVKHISAAHNSFAVKEDGALWAWGDNRHNQLGIGQTTVAYEPVIIF